MGESRFALPAFSGTQNARASIPFREEIELTRMYLGVEQVRFGEKLQTSIDVEPACGDCEVPALVIQPLVENAVKHGIALLE